MLGLNSVQGSAPRLALPINITTGFFGMNVGGVPLADSPHGFVLMAVVVGVITALAGWIAFRKRD